MNVRYPKTSFFLLASLIVLVLPYTRAREAPLPPEARRAVAIANQEARKRGFPHPHNRRTLLVDGNWEVLVDSGRYSAPGEHVTVIVSRDGKVLKYQPGL